MMIENEAWRVKIKKLLMDCYGMDAVSAEAQIKEKLEEAITSTEPSIEVLKNFYYNLLQR